MTTLCSAEGASCTSFVWSPPGWYWYLPLVPEIQGSDPGFMLTSCSELEEVGLRAAISISEIVYGEIVGLRVSTKVEASEAKGAAYNSHKDLSWLARSINIASV